MQMRFSPPLNKWFLKWIIRQNSFSKGWSPRNVYFEFGVFQGNSLLQFITAAKHFCSIYNKTIDDFKIYAFDSFLGLPEKKEGDNHPLWKSGQFACDMENLKLRISKTGFPLSNITFVPCFFEESLTNKLKNEILDKTNIPSIITIDVDYYSSTKSNSLLSSGIVFYFDDIWSFHGHPEMGEIKAINEFNQNGHGHLAPCHIYGLEHNSFMYSSKEWEWK